MGPTRFCGSTPPGVRTNVTGNRRRSEPNGKGVGLGAGAAGVPCGSCRNDLKIRKARTGIPYSSRALTIVSRVGLCQTGRGLPCSGQTSTLSAVTSAIPAPWADELGPLPQKERSQAQRGSRAKPPRLVTLYHAGFLSLI